MHEPVTRLTFLPVLFTLGHGKALILGPLTERRAKVLRWAAGILPVVLFVAAALPFWSEGARWIGMYGTCDAHEAPEFSLRRPDRTPLRSSDLTGSYVLVGFGTLGCRGTCPGLLTTMRQTLSTPRPPTLPLKGLFVTINPAGDSDASLAGIEDAELGIIAATSGEDIAEDVARAYHVFFDRDPRRLREAGYQFSHTTLTALLDPSGRVRCIYTMPSPDPDRILKDILQIHHEVKVR